MPTQKTDLKAKLCMFNDFIRRGDVERTEAFLAQHRDDRRFVRAIRLQMSMVEGFNDAAKDVTEIVKRLTTSPG